MAGYQRVQAAEAVNRCSVDRQQLVADVQNLPGVRGRSGHDAPDHDVRQLDPDGVTETFEGDCRRDLLRFRHLREIDLLLLRRGRAAEHVAYRQKCRATRERAAEQVFQQTGLTEANVDEVDTALAGGRALAGHAHERLQRVRAVGQEDVVLVRGDQVENAQGDHS